VLNLGNVTPNFYLTLKALETQGYINIRTSTQLSTLNGSEAKFGTTTTAYYLETTNNLVGQLNPTSQTTQTYKSVNADFTLSVNPMVSGDEQITMDVSIKQSNFTERISPSAPPGSVSRDFKSTVRVKNNEMIVLGGLDESSINNTGSGVPFLSRIPVLKWFFSSRTRAKGKNKLTVFLKPTVLY
jgi:type IV pilus assembly protein PilQ